MKILILLAVLCVPAVASAQVAATSYTLHIYTNGTATQVSTTAIPVGLFGCGQPRNTTAGTMHNPTTINFVDPANAALDCIYTDPGNGPLAALPTGQTLYQATLAAVSAAGVSSAESALSNFFDKPGVAPPQAPPVPGNVRIK